MRLRKDILYIIFIHRTAAALTASLSELSKAEDTEGAATAISDFWETRKLWVGLSVPQDTVREMSDRISEVCAKAKRKDPMRNFYTSQEVFI